jgi:hypothetical protein
LTLAYYELEGMKYQVVSDKSGYTMIVPSGEKSAVLRKTSNNNYIYKAKDKTSYGYFTADGNLILEHYDEATDTVTITTYKWAISKKKTCFIAKGFCFLSTLFSSRCAKCLSLISLFCFHMFIIWNTTIYWTYRTEAHHEILYIPYIFLEQCNIPHQISRLCIFSIHSVPSGKTTFPLI